MDHTRVDYISEVIRNIYLIFYRINNSVVDWCEKWKWSWENQLLHSAEKFRLTYVPISRNGTVPTSTWRALRSTEWRPVLLYKNWLKSDRVTDLLIELNVSEYGVNAPRLAEHGAKREREPDAEHPNLQLHTQRR